MKRGLRIVAVLEPWARNIALIGGTVADTFGAEDSIIKPVEFGPSPTPGVSIAPFLNLGLDQAQNLMDELWRCGLRPSEGSGSAGSLAATERHLTDMRRIVSKKLDVELK